MESGRENGFDIHLLHLPHEPTILKQSDKSGESFEVHGKCGVKYDDQKIYGKTKPNQLNLRTNLA